MQTVDVFNDFYDKLEDLYSNKTKPWCKLGQNTFLFMNEEGSEDSYVIKFHSTDIIKYRPNGDVELDTGGWNTYTTKKRMNDWTPDSISISGSHKEGAEWTVKRDGEIIATFTDKITIPSDSVWL